MKFSYVDESGDESQGDVFVMVGVLIDAYRLRKYTAKFDKMIVEFLARHPVARLSINDPSRTTPPDCQETPFRALSTNYRLQNNWCCRSGLN
jgi:hypothetical protein